MDKIKRYVELRSKLENTIRPIYSTMYYYLEIPEEEKNRLYNIDYNNYNSLETEVYNLRREIQKTRVGIYEYWKYIINEYKDFPRYKLIWRLQDRAKGLYYESVIEYKEEGDLLDHMYSKRPYGNKNIPASIMYSLGIDKLDVLEIIDIIPEEIEEWCMKLHEETIEYIKKFN